MKRCFFINVRLYVLLLISFSLTACGLFGGTDNSVPPTELEDIEKSARVSTTWSQSVGVGDDEAMVDLRPAIVDDEIFTVDREGQVTALSLSSGKINWKVDLDTTITGGIGVGEGIIIVGNTLGEIIVLDAENGEFKWQKQLSSVMLSVPLIQGDILIVRTGDGRIVALETEGGQQLWVYDRGVPVLTLRGNSSPVIGGKEVVFTGFDSGKVSAVVIKNGRPYWEVNAAVPRGRTDMERLVDIDADMILLGRVLYAVTYQGNIVAIDAVEGQVLWSKEMSSYAGITIGERHVYVTDSDSNLWSVDRVSGNLLWKQNKLAYRKLTAPAVVGDYVVVGDFEGYIHVLSNADGSLVGREKIDRDGFHVQPIVDDSGILYIYGKGGKLSALRVVHNE